MSTVVKPNKKNRSIEGFVNYVAMRHEKNEPISTSEKLDLYGLYQAYCEMNNVNFYHKLTFYKMIKNYGFESEPWWDKETRVTRKMYYITDEGMEHAIMVLRGIDTAKHITYINLGDQKYRVTTLYEPIGNNPLALDHSKV